MVHMALILTPISALVNVNTLYAVIRVLIWGVKLTLLLFVNKLVVNLNHILIPWYLSLNLVKFDNFGLANPGHPCFQRRSPWHELSLENICRLSLHAVDTAISLSRNSPPSACEANLQERSESRTVASLPPMHPFLCFPCNTLCSSSGEWKMSSAILTCLADSNQCRVKFLAPCLASPPPGLWNPETVFAPP